MADKRAVLIVTGEPNALARPTDHPRTIWEHGVALAPKWRYTLVKPGSWRGLLRGRLPTPGRAAAKISELVRWNHNRWPGAASFLIIPRGRQTFWRQVAEMSSALSHQDIATPDWPSTSRRWRSWAVKLKPGDLIMVDDTLASGQRLWRQLSTVAPRGVQLAQLGVLLAELRAFQPNQHRLVVAPEAQHLQLLAAGVTAPELAVANGAAERLATLRRELMSREPESILLLQPAADTSDLLERFKVDDELTQLTQLLDEHGYGVRVIGAPTHRTAGSWPVIDWSAGQKARLPAGWERRQARLRHAKQALHRHLS